MHIKPTKKFTLVEQEFGLHKKQTAKRQKDVRKNEIKLSITFKIK